ncbi:SHD1 domain-containing protein [Mariniblastus sp.]|nr:SHD1 domain-containing protein [Mariniblastus sp.]
MFKKLSVLLLFSIIVSFVSPILAQEPTRFTIEREWVDSSGKYTIKAKLIKAIENKDTSEIDAHLQLINGETKVVPMDKLSKKDNKFINEYLDGLYLRLKEKISLCVFAKDAHSLYADFLNNGFATDNNRLIIESRMNALAKNLDQELVIFKNEFIVKSELDARKKETLDKLNDWIKNTTSLPPKKNIIMAIADQKKLKESISNDPTTLQPIIVMALLSDVYSADYDKSQRYLERALEVGKRYQSIFTEDDNYHYLVAQNNLAVSYLMSNRVPKAIRTLENLVFGSESNSATTNISTVSVPVQVKQNIAKLDKMLQSQLAKEFAVGLQCDQEDKESIFSLKSKLGATDHSNGWKLMLPRGTEDIGFVIPKGRQRISGVPGKGSIYTFSYDGKPVIQVPLNGSWIKNGEIENFRCINCTGTGKVRCTAPLCKKGSIKVRDFGWLDSKQQHWGPTGYHFDPCKNCKGTGLLLCPCCYNSKFKNSFGLQITW